VLERRFRYSEGVKMRIRRIAESEPKRGCLIEGETLLEADYNLNIDNMEGIAAHRVVSGETILTLISDDNFSLLQRTLLMRFALPQTLPLRGHARLRRTPPLPRFASWRFPASAALPSGRDRPPAP
jgi:hypothetical protein